jgi:RNA polymerase sigma-70 factor (ECF subfamily)
VKGDAEFDRVVRAHGAALSRVVRGYVRDDAEHEDLMQDVLVAIWRALPRFRGEASERTFVFRIAHNRACTHVSKRRDDEPIAAGESIPDPRPGPDEEMDSAHMRRRLLTAVRTLPDAQRQAVLLRLEGFSLGEIAALQDVTENNVSVRLTRARERLGELLKGDGP